MNTAPFTDEEAEDFWNEAQCEIYGEGENRHADMMHASSGEQFCRWVGWVKTLDGHPLENFDLLSCYNSLADWFLYPFAHPDVQRDIRFPLYKTLESPSCFPGSEVNEQGVALGDAAPCSRAEV